VHLLVTTKILAYKVRATHCQSNPAPEARNKVKEANKNMVYFTTGFNDLIFLIYFKLKLRHIRFKKYFISCWI